MRTVLHLIDVAELIRLSRASYWGRSMLTLSRGPTRDPTDIHPPINHWSPPSGLRFLGESPTAPFRRLCCLPVGSAWLPQIVRFLSIAGTRSYSDVVSVPEHQLLSRDKIWTTPVAYLVDRGLPAGNIGPTAGDYINGRALAEKS